ncbi:hypothetical protein PFHG_03717 [Plasmodium falciparum HB3]|uniref:Erythrocyte membrane protein 1 n=1 Tax=Plasmodium falciparum (isolate HB3) TaxID=137071 RepID=A0A0L7KFN8_PLAFX|nr:hypothetical protein PFHG_03717 [Plasmodium falciparum HB3]
MEANNYDSGNAKHNLLVDVCMAAKYEGDSIKNYYPKYQRTYGDSPSQICTMLARSFADIGDIVRGKDLFYGNPQEKEQREKLDEKLKEIFKKIHDNLVEKKGNEAKDRYKDEPDNNFYQLREDWWMANRDQVWKAITCKADNSNRYFRQTCGSGEKGSATTGKCRCSDKPKSGKPGDVSIVPTYFDYVPQYLRWFEEWAEDFCRIRKHKLEDAIKKCREKVKEDKKLYCDLNRHDCEKTASGKHDFFVEDDCKYCHFSCSHFVKWIDNQKVEFLKQKKKYDKEIKKANGKNGTSITIGKTTINNIYAKEFYKKLKRAKYKDVETFLGKLNEEGICQKPPEVGEEKADHVDFTKNKIDKTFDHTTYCQACPWCGAEPKSGGGWIAKDDKTCGEGKDYTKYKKTEIPILTGDKTKSDMVKKYKKFCDSVNGEKGAPGTANGGGQIKKWECYYDEHETSSKKNNNCVEGTWQNFRGKQTVKSYNVFFWDWVYHMLHDSLDWRNELDNCLKNENKQCIIKCNRKCDCFLKWVKQKEQEWGKIKDHFGKQKDIVQVGGFLGSLFSSPDFVLEEVLKDGNLLQNIKDVHGDTDDIERIEALLKETGVAASGVSGIGGATGKNTKIDKFLQEELNEANRCKNCQETQKPGGDGAVARSDSASPDQQPQTPAQEDEEDEEEEEEEDDDNGAEDKDHQEDATVDVDEEAAKETTENQEDKTPKVEVEGKPACDIVKELFKDTSKFKDACDLKYNKGKNYGWRCVAPSGDKTGTISEGSGVGDRGALQRNKRDTDLSVTPTSDKGSICVPPRRRKLYVGKLEQWAESKQVGNTQGGSDSSQGTTEGSKSPQAVGGQATLSAASTETPESSLLRDGLREAFVESAAVETFFLWHKYKVDKKKEEEEKEERERENGGFGHSGEDDDPKPEDELKSGTIPNDFLRLMFYTLGDYRDILFSGGITGDSSSDKDSSSSNHEKNLVVLLSENKQDMEKIQKKIDEMIKQGENKESAIGGPKSLSVTHTQPSDKLTQWWDKIAEPIWNAMVCALTYKESDEKPTDDTNKIEQNSGLKEAFFGKDNNPDNKGTYNDRYQYSSVTLKDEQSGAKPNEPPSPASENKPTTLDSFIKRPPYFRYLEEWGQNFCKKRTEMLGKIKGECKVDNADYKCSCYGEECKIEDISNIGVFADLKCPGCGRECRKYKKWIGRKKIEFEEQKSAYDGQKTKCQSKSEGGDNGFCGTVQRCSKAAEFLQKLGPCSKNDIPEYKIDFSNTDQTFAHAKYCKPCSEFKIDCTKAKCTGAGTNDMCKGKNITITADNFQEKMAQSTQKLDMLVSDNSKSGNGFKDVLNECENANIFKGIRKEQWECGNFCGLDVCGLKRDNGKNYDQIILIRAFIERWLEYFLEDYNKIKHKISHRMNNGEQSPCIKGCKDKCSCVEKWVEQKKEEWKKIKEHYQKQYGGNDSGESYPVKTILEKFEHRPEFNKAIKPCPNLNKFESFCGLNGAEKSKTKDDKDNDLLLCMLKKLEKKATSCPGKHSGSEQCTTPPSNLEDDEEPYEDLLLDETEENTEEAKKKMMSKICDGVIKPEEETDDNCGKLDEEEKEEEKDKGDEEEEAPRDSAGSSTDQESKKPPEEKSQESVKPAPASPPAPPSPLPPSDESILQTTIPFGVALALGSIAFLFLKKKTKASVGNLFQILQIPKSDYNIPTKLSPNRYIPYTSGKYRGKRYIYLEGDSGTDSGYTDHYSDITSSSESEYEELDINDIYVPHAPKYKTLIEVVLEPSGNNTTASGNNTPSDNTPTPPPITDDEWNTLKDEFISQYLQSEQPNDVPNDYKSGDIPLNTQPNTLYFDKPEEKPFIMSIHDRDLYSGEEYNYNVDMVNTMDDIPINRDNNVYSGIDLINDTLSGNQHIDIYDELLKRKENELFGTNHVKHTTINRVAKPARDDPIHNQLELFHKWLDRHRDMCEKWNNKEELLAKLKELWENETHSGNTHPSDSNKTLNTDVSIQIHMDHEKRMKEFTNMDTYPENSTMDSILEDLEKYKEPYYDVQDDIYYDVNDHDTSTVDSNAMDVPSKVQIEMDVNTKLVKEKYPIGDVWDI